VSPANFGYYTGSGTFDLSGMTLSTTTFTGGGNNIQLGVNETALMSASVTYDFVSIPEPGTMLLLGSALIGVGVITRKRRVR
jgi:hypothetical protein